MEGPERRSAWEELAARAEGATFFHTPAWADVLVSTFPAWEPATEVIELGPEPLRETRCVLPMLRRGGTLESMPPGVYGGPLFERPPTAEELARVWDLLDERPSWFLYGNPYVDYVVEPGGARQELFTQTIDLAPGFDTLQRRFRRRYREGIRAAARRGYEVSTAQDLEDVEGYCDVYEDTLRRWGTSARGFYPRALFRNLHLASLTNEAIRLWVVRRQGELVGGGWFFRHAGHLAYWHGAVLERDMRGYPMHLLMANVIEDACRQEVRTFDFNPSAGLGGVEAFKRGFGAERHPFASWRRSTPLDKTTQHLRRVRERWFRQCPL